jgi:flagellar basal body-associated protein FliL
MNPQTTSYPSNPTIQPNMFTSADLENGSVPLPENTGTVRYSKYNLAKPDLVEGGAPLSSHLPNEYPPSPVNTPPEPVKESEAPEPLAPAASPSESYNRSKIFIIIGIAILAATLLIGGGVAIYMSTRPAEKVAPTATTDTNNDTVAQEETEKATVAPQPALKEAPAASATINSPTVAQNSNDAIATNIPSQSIAGPNPSENNNQTLPKSGPSLASIIINLALAVILFVASKRLFLKFSKLKYRR